MKINGDNFKKLESAIIAAKPISLSRAQLLEKYPRIKDIEVAYSHHLLHVSGFRIGDGVGFVGDINGDFNDDHIATALKKIVLNNSL